MKKRSLGYIILGGALFASIAAVVAWSFRAMGMLI